MNFKSQIWSLVLAPMVALSSLQAKAETEYVILKNPEFTDVLKIGFDTKKETVSVERCFDYSHQALNCQQIGKAMPIAGLESVQDQISKKGNYISGGAVLAGITYFGVMSLCMAKNKCAGFQNLIFPTQKKSIDWGLYLGLGAGVAGGVAGAYLGDGELTDSRDVLQIKSAIDQALQREDQEIGALVVETGASLNEIAESFSMLQLLMSQTKN